MRGCSRGEVVTARKAPVFIFENRDVGFFISIFRNSLYIKEISCSCVI